METAYRQSAKVLRQWKPRIDWSHPLTAGLRVCYVPGLAGGVDIAAQGAGSLDLTISSACSFDVGPDGPALKVNASTSPNYAAKYESVPSTHPLRNWTECSFFTRLAKTPGQTIPSDGPCIWAIEHNNAVSNPYVAAGIGLYDASSVGLYWNSGGTFDFDTPTLGKSISGAASDVPFNIIGTFKVGGNAQIFVDIGGTVSTGSSAFGASGPTYGSTATLDLGALTGQDCAPFKYEIAAWWNRELTSEEKYYLSQNPFCFLVFDEEDTAPSQPAGGTTYNESRSETAAAADAESATGVFASSIGEAAAASDSESATGAFAASLGEAAAAADTQSPGSIAGSVSETAGAADSVSAAVVGAPSLSESAAAADSASSQAAFVAGAAEAAGAVDAPLAGASILIGLGRVVQVLWDTSPVPSAAETWDADLSIASFSAAADTATATGHGFAVNTLPGPFLLSCPAGFPGGLDGTTPYWLIVVDANTIKFATSAANARAGTAVNITSAGTSPFTLLRKIDTTSGSAIATIVMRGIWANDGSAATDNKSNNFSDFDQQRAYDGYPSSRARLRVDLSASTGSGHKVSATVADKGGGLSDEVTAAIVEIKNAAKIADYAIAESSSAGTITSPAVDLPGEGLVVIFVCGNGPTGQEHIFSPTDSNWIKLPEASAEGNPNSVGYIQLSVFSRYYSGAQSGITASFNGTSNEGAMFFALAFQPPTATASLNESAGAADAESGTLNIAASVSDTASAGGSQSATIVGSASAAESAASSDAPAATGVFASTAAETATAAGAQSAALAAAGSLGEAATAQDTASAGLAAVASAAETASAADAPSSQLAAQASLAEAASATDAPDGSIAGQDYSVAETAAASDAASSQMAGVGALGETAAASDAPAATIVGASAAAESAAVVDAVAGATVISAARAESAAAGESESASLVSAPSQADSAAATDAPSATTVGVASATEAAEAADAASATGVFGAAQGESAGAGDQPSIGTSYDDIRAETASAASAATYVAGTTRTIVSLQGRVAGTITLAAVADDDELDVTLYGRVGKTVELEASRP